MGAAHIDLSCNGLTRDCTYDKPLTALIIPSIWSRLVRPQSSFDSRRVRSVLVLLVLILRLRGSPLSKVQRLESFVQCGGGVGASACSCRKCLCVGQGFVCKCVICASTEGKRIPEGTRAKVTFGALLIRQVLLLVLSDSFFVCACVYSL